MLSNSIGKLLEVVVVFGGGSPYSVKMDQMGPQPYMRKWRMKYSQYTATLAASQFHQFHLATMTSQQQQRLSL